MLELLDLCDIVKIAIVEGLDEGGGGGVRRGGVSLSVVNKILDN